jgi:hypothetical protein
MLGAGNQSEIQGTAKRYNEQMAITILLENEKSRMKQWLMQWNQSMQMKERHRKSDLQQFVEREKEPIEKFAEEK